MDDFERLGAFYLGKREPAPGSADTGEIVLYDARDLTTHAVIIGMTGSGKTGLGLAIIEEAAIDRVPVIAIDPKGDIGNLMLTFPALAADDFQPWIDPASALQSGRTVAEQAAVTAAQWRQGLAEWGQDGERIAKLRQAAEVTIYTPGSSAGQPVSVLKQFAAPPSPESADPDAFRDRVESTVQSLLTLLDIDADPLTSREHILIANILAKSWREGRDLGLPELIGAIQKPAFERVGILDLNAFFPPSDRFALAMRINNLLAAPGFDVWTRGDPLDVDRLLFTGQGQPRVSVLAISHLSDSQRMFFVTRLLGELIAWMRRQPGSPSLRALLYMDEVFGFLPPVANPPAKQQFLTLLKQARAYGLGLVLATQNPVDVDYKALSNAGTWFIGRLQTERDVDRVRDGLASAGRLSPALLDSMLAGMPKRSFVLHNVHDDGPIVFRTRWVMSYLAGPLTGAQISQLSDPRRSEPPTPARAELRAAVGDSQLGPPIMDPAIRQFFVPVRAMPEAPDVLAYVPHLIGNVSVAYERRSLDIDERREYLVAVPETDSAIGLDWDRVLDLEIAVEALATEAEPGATFNTCGKTLADPKFVAKTPTQLARWVKRARPLTIFRSKELKAYSTAGETERDFRIRLQQLGNEIRDRKVAALRKRFEAKYAAFRERLRRAEQAVAREAEQASAQKVDAVVSVGSALLGALLGRKAISATSASRVGTAIRKAGAAGKQSGDVRRARDSVAAIQAGLEQLEREFDAEVDALDAAYDALADDLDTLQIRPAASNVQVSLWGVGWLPFARTPEGMLQRL